jgi:hypothetical protein
MNIEFRKRHSENIKEDIQTSNWTSGESALFVRTFAKEQQYLLSLPRDKISSISIVTRTFARAVIKSLEQAGY